MSENVGMRIAEADAAGAATMLDIPVVVRGDYAA
jgi:hypothetical protein